VSQLRDDAVPDFDGDYHCYLDNTTLLDLFQDYGDSAVIDSDTPAN
jgi:hypothetical protein